jgi:hypothetical protein
MDEQLAARVANAMRENPALRDVEVVEKRMFGGVGYMVRGNMACGVNGKDVIVRVGPDAYAASLAAPHTRPFDMTGRPMKGWVVVTLDGHTRDEDLAAWVARGVAFALTLPAK